MRLFLSFLLLTTLPNTLEAQVPTDNLLLHMPFNGNAIDETGNGNNGLVSGPSLTIDRFGNQNAAYVFNGVDHRIDITNSNLLPDNSATISYWFAPASDLNFLSDYQVMFQSDIPGDTDGDFLLGFNRSNCYSAANTNDGKINFELQGDLVNGNSSVCNAYGLTRVGSTTNTWDAATWYMITAIVNEGQIKIYVNGTLEATHPCTSSLFVNGQGITLGRYDAPQHTSPFQGALDDIRIYSRALTDQEIGSLYNEFVGVEAITEATSIKVYPNPTSNKVMIEGENLTGGHVSLVNALGQTQLEVSMHGDQTELDLTNISSKGVYFVQLFNSVGELIEVEKLIVE